MRWEVVATTRSVNGDIPMITKQLAGRVDNTAYPLLSVIIRATVNTPADTTRAVPVIVQLGGGLGPIEGIEAPLNPCARPGGVPPRGRGPVPEPTGPTWQQQILSRGWGYAILDTGTVQGDCGAGLTSGIIGLANKGQPRSVDDWGALSAWAWGASRLLDYMETDGAVDASHTGVQGHSRWGKAALVAMAFDQRFAIGYISSSGQGGAKLHRRKYGETIENVASGFYYWMAGNYIKYAGHWDTLPVDSLELVALCAPRPVFLSAGRGPGETNPDGTIQANDAWVDPKGSCLAAAAAGPVYELLGKKGLGTGVSGDRHGARRRRYRVPPACRRTREPTWPTFLAFMAATSRRSSAPRR